MRAFTRTPLGVIGLGAAAGLAGTAVMTAVQLAEQRLRGSGESGPPKSWDEAPAPAQVGERVARGVFQRPIDLDQAPRVTNVVHWSYGMAWGVAFAVVQRSLGIPVLPAAAGFGTLVWASDYVVLPAMKIYEPAWKYPASTLAVDLARHLAYGAGVAGAYALLEQQTAPRPGRVQRLLRRG
jgi:hypothetical protein